MSQAREQLDKAVEGYMGKFSDIKPASPVEIVDHVDLYAGRKTIAHTGTIEISPHKAEHSPAQPNPRHYPHIKVTDNCGDIEFSQWWSKDIRSDEEQAGIEKRFPNPLSRFLNNPTKSKAEHS